MRCATIITKPGVRGLLLVTAGQVDLIYKVPARTVRVTPGRLGLIVPEALHHVFAKGEIRMPVEFYRDRLVR